MIYAAPSNDQAGGAACGHEPFHCSTNAQKTAASAWSRNHSAIKIAARGVPPGNPRGGLRRIAGAIGARRRGGRRPLAAILIADGAWSHVLCHSTKDGLIIAESRMLSKPSGKVRKFDSSIRCPS